MRQFRCIGADCELTCCQGWGITSDEPHRLKIEQKLSGTPEGRAELQQAFGETPDPKTGVLVKLRPDTGQCSFLGSDRLCSLQRRFGEETLPNTCAQYPRSLSTVGSHREMFGFLSCPEVARNSLLAANGMALCETELALSRPFDWTVRLDSAVPYHQPFEEVRAAGYTILSLRNFPIASRLFFLAYLGKRTADFFGHDAKEIDPNHLTSELARLRDPNLLRQLHEGFAGLKVPTQVAAAIVVGILRAQPDAVLVSLVSRVFSTFVDDGIVAANSLEKVSDHVGEVWASYAQRRAFWEASLPQLVNLGFENYAKNYWLRDRYVGSPTLLAHVQSHLFQVAVIRFLVFCHPDLVAAQNAETPEKEKAFGRTLVDVISRVSRAIEHRTEFVKQVEQSFKEHGMQDFAHATILARA
jgi:lysine-N-methylase